MKHGKQSEERRGPGFYFQEAYYLAKELERLPPDAPGRSRKMCIRDRGQAILPPARRMYRPAAGTRGR